VGINRAPINFGNVGAPPLGMGGVADPINDATSHYHAELSRSYSNGAIVWRSAGK